MLGVYQDFLVAFCNTKNHIKVTEPWALRLSLLEVTQDFIEIIGEDGSYKTTVKNFEDIRENLGDVLSYLLLILGETGTRLDIERLMEHIDTTLTVLPCNKALVPAVGRFLDSGCTPEKAYDVVHAIQRIAVHYNSNLTKLVVWKWDTLLKRWKEEL